VHSSCLRADARAQTPAPPQPLSFAQQQALRTALNNTTLLVAAGQADGTHYAMARDIAEALGDSPDVRVLPVATAGGADSLRDLLFLRGVDLAIVPANVLSQSKVLDAHVGPGLPQRLAFISYLYAEDVHLLAGRDVARLDDLRRKQVAVPAGDSNALFTARDVFERLGIEVELVTLRGGDAIEQARSGAVAAVLLVGSRPLRALANLPKDGRLKFIDMPLPRAMEPTYAPAAISAEDYPNLIPPGLTASTISIGTVLLANAVARGNEDTARRTGRFVPAFFARVASLSLAGHNAKWREVNLAAQLPGWTRLPAADDWLRTAREQQKITLQKEFDEFLRSTRGTAETTPAQRKKLFDDFVEWTRQSVGGRQEAAQR
jgi:TRAP-type uncharacterized transport system substrate-binding protein